ncbi:hypothetical protein UA08_06684 [Talaromyces atroroseus]|uniref:Zn(2)-C6 fungal-type domain-containing protein n=1 Tax=Talaromyces atroroseus TaxID=1441469 RepID=A0A225AFX5_TALAT|nr:hypothetical protein UA08_06684 [Talaromyces atroroseus]OKL58053.1 hypothetical protein UA08_06684 [Talaromyces atroroseus]
MQQGSPCQVDPEQQPTLEDRRYDINVSRSSANTSNEVFCDGTEFNPTLPESVPTNWDELLATSSDLATKNEGSETGVTPGLFMSTFNSLDNPRGIEQVISHPAHFNPASTTEYPFDFGFNNPMNSFSQTNPYQPDTGKFVATDMGLAHTVGPVMAGTTMRMQNTTVFQSKNTDYDSLTSPSELFEIEHSRTNALSPVADLDGEKRKRKIRSDKGIKRGPNLAKGMAAKDRDCLHGDENNDKEANKRKRNLEDDEEGAQDECEVPQKHARHDEDDLEESVPNETDMQTVTSRRPKWGRKKGHPNIRYRYNLRLKKQEEQEDEQTTNGGILSTASVSEGVSKLFQLLQTAVTPKKNYSRNKNRFKEAAAPLSDQATAVQEKSNEVISNTDEVSKTTKAKVSREKHNPRPPISEDIVRSTAPEGWDPYDNAFYSGDDNISDDGLEDRGKASAYKPPRMACRRCNKLKQPCDHKYPSCSLCAKNNLRCRYRDDLTGRQIRPGQLEEVEAAYYQSTQQIQRLDETVKNQQELLEEAYQRIEAWQTTARNIMDLRNIPADGLWVEGLQSGEPFIER